MKYFVGVDIGATWIRIAVATEHGKIIDRIKGRTPQRGNPSILSSVIINLIRKMLIRNNIRRVESIGIGSIGPLDLIKGVITNPPNISMKNIPISKPLYEEFNVPVYLVNDCTAGVLGEKIFGAGKNIDNLFYLTLSSGIGGGAIVDGKLLFGKDGNAPEIGHIVVDLKGKLKCGCGGYGHWEAYAGGKNIPKYAKLLIKEKFGICMFKKSKLYNMVKGDPDKITTEMIFSAAKENDELAKLIVDELGRINTIGVATIINVFDPELITIGGAIALNNPELILKPILENIRKYVINRIPKIEITPLGDDIVLYGALAIAMNPHYIPSKFRRFE